MKKKYTVPLVFFLIGMVITTIGSLFKIMHWPGSLLLSYFGFSLLVFVFIPFYTIRNYKTSENKLFAISKSLFFSLSIIFCKSEF